MGFRDFLKRKREMANEEYVELEKAESSEFQHEQRMRKVEARARLLIRKEKVNKLTRPIKRGISWAGRTAGNAVIGKIAQIEAENRLARKYDNEERRKASVNRIRNAAKKRYAPTKTSRYGPTKHYNQFGLAGGGSRSSGRSSEMGGIAGMNSIIGFDVFGSTKKKKRG